MVDMAGRFEVCRPLRTLDRTAELQVMRLMTGIEAPARRQPLPARPPDDVAVVRKARRFARDFGDALMRLGIVRRSRPRRAGCNAGGR